MVITILFNVLGILGSVGLGILFFKRRDIRWYSGRGVTIWSQFPSNFNYLWAGLIPGAGGGIIAKIAEITGGQSPTTIGVFKVLAVAFVAAVAVATVIQLLKKDKPYYWGTRFVIKVLMVGSGLFGGLFLAGIAITAALIALVIFIIATPSGDSSSSGSSASEDNRKYCVHCSYYDCGKCTRDGHFYPSGHECHY